MELMKVMCVEASEMVGGSSISLYNLLKAIDKSKYSPLVIFFFDNPYRMKFEEEGIKTFLIAPHGICWSNRQKKIIYKRGRIVQKWIGLLQLGLKYLISISSLSIRLYFLIRRERVALVHVNQPPYFASLHSSAFLAATMARVPLISHMRTSRELKSRDQICAKMATKIITLTETARQRYINEQRLTAEKLVTIYNGVDMKEYNPAISGSKIRKEFGINPSSPIVGIVGRLYEGKGVECFLTAAAKVLKTHPNVKFLIVGDGGRSSLRGHLEKQAKSLNISRDVIFTGFRMDVPEIIAALDIVVFASYLTEGLPGVIIQAMAMGKPVVASKLPSVSEMIETGKSGLLFPLRDSSSIAESLLALLEDREKALEIGRAARVRAEKLFDIQECARKTTLLYNELLERPHNSRKN